MKRKSLLVLIFFYFFLGGFVFAQAPVKEPPPINAPTVTMSKIGDQGIYGIAGIIQKFGGWLLLIAGAVAVVMIIVGGVRYMISMGNPQQTEGAKKTIIYALVGLIVIISSFSIARIVTFLFSSTPQPEIVKEISDKIESGEIQGKVSQCQYNGEVVFNTPIPSQGPDSYISALYNAEGEVICYTDGGISGKGDIISKCPGFDPTKCPAQ